MIFVISRKNLMRRIVIGGKTHNLVKVGILVLVIGVLSFVIVMKSRMLVIYIFMFGIERF